MQNFIGVLVDIADLLDEFPALLDSFFLVSFFLLLDFGKVGLDRLVLIFVGRKLELVTERVEFDMSAMFFLAKKHAILPADGESPAFVALHLTIYYYSKLALPKINASINQAMVMRDAFFLSLSSLDLFSSLLKKKYKLTPTATKEFVRMTVQSDAVFFYSSVLSGSPNPKPI